MLAFVRGFAVRNLNLILGAVLVISSLSAGTVESSAERLERRNLYEYRANRKWTQDRLWRNRTRRTRAGPNYGSGNYNFFSIFRSRRWDNTDVEPEAKPEFYVYRPNLMVELRNAKLTGEISARPFARWIYDTLRAGSKPAMRTLPGDKKAILAFYAERKFEPLWISYFGLNLRAKRLIDALSRAADDGLTVSNYVPPVLASFDEIPEELFKDPEAVADLEIGLTAMALMFARHASGGQVAPNKIGRSFDLSPPVVEPASALKALSGTLHPEEYLDSLHPVHPLYARMKAMLAEERSPASKNEDEPIPDGELIRSGSFDYRVPMIVKRLKKQGFLPEGRDTPGDSSNNPGSSIATRIDDAENADPVQSDLSRYDEVIVQAVREFQGSVGLTRDGIVGSRTIAALNGQNQTMLAEKLEINMERMRWLARFLGDRYVIVNQASYQAQLIENGIKIHQMRVIVGKPTHPTPLFSDELETVVFNPYWNVPQSIAMNEYLPKLMDDPGYLDRQGFEVRDSQGQLVRSYAVDWWSYYGDTLPFDVRQPPGVRNALGEVKFLFPNKHAVYMHDTPNRNLFDSDSRAFSHGCVRIQNPREFAQIILGWSSEAVSDAINTGRNQQVGVNSKIPVHLTYFTLWPDASGNIIAFSDFYKRDKALKKALDITRAALN